MVPVDPRAQINVGATRGCHPRGLESRPSVQKAGMMMATEENALEARKVGEYGLT